MKRISIVGLFLAAVFAFSAMAASSASAADLLAQVHGGGSIVGVTFLSTATLPRLITHNGSEIHCKHATNHGLFLTATLGNILIRFLGCTTANPFGGRLPCQTTGAGKEEIHLTLSTLFHLGLAHLVLPGGTVHRLPAAVILLGKTIVINCEEGIVKAKIEVLGSVIGALRLDEGSQSHEPIPLNTPFSTALLSFEQTANGLQHLRLILLPGSTTPTTFDLDANLNGGAFELASEVANALLDLFRLGNGNHVELELVEP